MKVALLARVSDKKQAAEERYSLPAQLRVMRERCEREGWEVVREYVGGGESAFTNQVGKPMDAGGLKRTWKRVIRDANVGHVRFHDLRHASATYLLQAGVSVKVVSERLCHSRTSTTTDTYAHVMPGMGREAAETLERVMRR